MVATLTVAFPDLSILLPLVRFPSSTWIVLAAFLLPHPPSLHHTQQPYIEDPTRGPSVTIGFYVVADLPPPFATTRRSR